MTKQYYDTFKKKNSEKIKEKHICEICGGSYTYFYKSKHNKMKKHLFSLNLINKLIN